MLKETILSFSLKIITSLQSEPLLCLKYCKHSEATPAQVNLCERYEEFHSSVWKSGCSHCGYSQNCQRLIIEYSLPCLAGRRFEEVMVFYSRQM